MNPINNSDNKEKKTESSERLKQTFKDLTSLVDNIEDKLSGEDLENLNRVLSGIRWIIADSSEFANKNIPKKLDAAALLISQLTIGGKEFRLEDEVDNIVNGIRTGVALSSPDKE